jgi:uncharacterized membrane protein YfcA
VVSLEFWYMLPAAVLIATTAMASGVEGATFFSPLFILALGLAPEVAIGTGLVTEVFGFDSGLYAYATKRLMDYRLGAALLIVTIPMALVGTWVSGVVAQDSLEDVLGVGLVAVTASFLQATNHENVELIDSDIRREEAIPGSVSSTATSCSSVATSQARGRSPPTSSSLPGRSPPRSGTHSSSRRETTASLAPS